MRFFVAFLLTTVFAANALSAEAGTTQLNQSAPPPLPAAEAPLAAITPAERLDRYFMKLRRTRDPVAAGDIAANIWALWNDSGSATVNLLMQWADDAMKKRRFPAALDYLSQAIALKPDYAEAWNRRATLHFHAGNYAKSMADIAQVLKLEPRHFGALSGMAMILEQSGQDRQALGVWEKVLEIYPADREAQSHLQVLTDKLTGTRT